MSLRLKRGNWGNVIQFGIRVINVFFFFRIFFEASVYVISILGNLEEMRGKQLHSF